MAAPRTRRVRPGTDPRGLLLGGTDGVVLSGLSTNEADLLTHSGGCSGDLVRWTALRRGVGEHRAEQLVGLLRRHGHLAPAPRDGSGPLSSAVVLVDGAGTFPREIADQLRRVGMGTVYAGPHVLDALESDPQELAGRSLAVVAVSATPPGPSMSACWHRAGALQLPVTGTGREATIGPLVIPGVSSCAVCHDLRRGDLDRGWPQFAARLRAGGIGGVAVPPTDARLAVLGAAVVAVTLADALTGGTDLGGVSTDVTADLPGLTHRFWPRHPRCPCTTPGAGAGEADDAASVTMTR